MVRETIGEDKILVFCSISQANFYKTYNHIIALDGGCKSALGSERVD